MLTSPMLSRPEQAIEHAREIIKQQLIIPLMEDLSGPVIEIQSTEHTPSFHYWNTPDAFLDQCDPVSYASVEELVGTSDFRPAQLAFWLFGPGWVAAPAEVHRFLSQSVVSGGAVVVACETPWSGKILPQGKFAEYTTEEVTAALVRAGFDELAELTGSPTFGLWQGTHQGNSARQQFLRAESLLAQGDWAGAETALMEISDRLGSIHAVREYALLVAAYHDLAGRLPEALAALSEALKLDPQCARAMCGLGRIAALNGDLQSAEEFFKAALDHQPALVAALYGRAAVCEAMNDLKGAFKFISTAAELRPHNASLIVELERLGLQTGCHGELSQFFLQHHGVTLSTAASLTTSPPTPTC